MCEILSSFPFDWFRKKEKNQNEQLCTIAQYEYGPVKLTSIVVRLFVSYPKIQSVLRIVTINDFNALNEFTKKIFGHNLIKQTIHNFSRIS